MAQARANAERGRGLSRLREGDNEYLRPQPSAEEIAYAAQQSASRRFPLHQHADRSRQSIDRDGVGRTDTDVVQMINYAVAQLRGKAPQMRIEVKLHDTEALWLLAHLVGDIHQPLHVGADLLRQATCKTCVNDPTTVGTARCASPTIGGNRIMLGVERAAPPAAPTLHHLLGRRSGAQRDACSRILGRRAGFRKLLAAIAAGWLEDVERRPDTWADTVGRPRSCRLRGAPTRRRSSVKDEARLPSRMLVLCWTTLNATYRTWAQEHAREQLAKAGFRLAALLVAIFKVENRRRYFAATTMISTL